MKLITRVAVEWGMRCFGVLHMRDRKARALRLAEEAIELCQSVDVPHEQIVTLARIVYSRPRGEPLQELGGVLLTAAVMANLLGADVEKVAEDELCRCLSRSPEDFARRNEEKNRLGLAG